MALRTLPSQEELAKLFTYDPNTGILTRRPRPRSDFTSNQAHAVYNTCFAGKPCLTDRGNGYIVVMLNMQQETAHRLIWKLVTGVDPTRLDHIDGDPTNNRLANLRIAEAWQNSGNARAHRTPGQASPYRGVTRRGKSWEASITVQGQRHYLGSSFRTEEAAATAYREAAERLRGEFSGNHR